MVFRVYVCEKCDKTFELNEPIRQDPLKSCPDCGEKIFQDLSGISFSIKGEAKTLLQQAEINDKKLGKSKLEEIRAKEQENKERAADITAQKLGLKKPKKGKRSWDKLSKEKEKQIFDKPTKKEQNEAARKYILGGE